MNAIATMSEVFFNQLSRALNTTKRSSSCREWRSAALRGRSLLYRVGNTAKRHIAAAEQIDL
jgi:hypothetical protein